MDREEEFFGKRIKDLAQQSYQGNRYTFTGFLGMAEQSLFWEMLPSLPSREYTLFGGANGCERVVLRFGSEASLGYVEEFPIRCIEIIPLSEKFAQQLSHRDYLGALMNLGVERSMLGDIQIRGKRAYVFCLDKMEEFLIANLDRINRTPVKCKSLENAPELLAPTLQKETLIVSSERLDGLISKIYHMSRNDSLLLFRQKKIFVNGRQMENNSGICKVGDIVSVRGFGRFVYEGASGQTRKGNLNVTISKYVT